MVNRLNASVKSVGFKIRPLFFVTLTLMFLFFNFNLFSWENFHVKILSFSVYRSLDVNGSRHGSMTATLLWSLEILPAPSALAVLPKPLEIFQMRQTSFFPPVNLNVQDSCICTKQPVSPYCLESYLSHTHTNTHTHTHINKLAYTKCRFPLSPITSIYGIRTLPYL